MKHIVIIGNSAAGVGVVEAVREKDKSSRITMLSEEPFSAYERPKILGVLENRLKERQLVWRNLDFYKNNGVELRLDTKAEGVSLHRKRVSFRGKDTDPLEFDELVIACGRKESLPSLKGVQKEGVLGLNGLTEVKFIQENLPLAHTVLVSGQGAVAEALAKIIAEKKIEVKFFGPLSAPVEGVEVVADNPIIEILGESEIRAVRLSSQKVVGATLLVFSGNLSGRQDFLEETDIQQDQGILVDGELRTSVPFVWAAGDCNQPRDGQKQYGWDAAYAQGRKLGEGLCRS
ncbi:MAG: FAD-dependent oxidoreductase [Candidatus Omnitrophota bacterium]